jgi:hypothetical protein
MREEGRTTGYLLRPRFGAGSDAAARLRLSVRLFVNPMQWVRPRGAAQLAKSPWTGSSAWVGYMTSLQTRVCRGAHASGFCTPGSVHACSREARLLQRSLQVLVLLRL